MITLVMNDALIAQNELSHEVKIPREQRLFTKRIEPSTGQAVKHRVSLRISELDRSNDFQFPSTSWLFAEKSDPDYIPYQKTLVHSHDLQVDEWPSFKLENPDPVNSPIPFGDTLLDLQFFQNPVSTTYEKQTFNLWALDQFADIGGFLVFTFILFGLPCMTI